MEKGTSINHYEIVDKLGEGGMGVVYKATDTKLNRTVALKFLPPHLTKSKKDEQRFIREAQAAAALNHPNICTIHNVEEYEGRNFISMEFIDGVTLREKLHSGNLTPANALEYGIRIVSALSEAHEKGIVHRDIKPGNIMVDSKDRVKVMDFGLAKLAGSAPITKSGTTVGTMAYMAPEQIQGRPVDHRADLFSFGVLLFEMLTGQRPFNGQYDAALTYSIVHEEPPPLTDFLPEAPQKLSNLVSHLLEKDPAKRYSKTEQLASDLQACLDQLPDSIEDSKVATATTTQTETGNSSGSTSITINLPSLASRNGILSLAGIVIVLALIGYWLIPRSGSPSSPTNNKIAVLPLESISTEPEDVQFTDGVHEELINRLAGISDLTVIARSSVRGFEPGERDLHSIGDQLDVSSLMEGTVRRMGDQFRVSVQLIDANSLGTIWSGSFDENIDNVFEIQSRIARQVASELQASLNQEEQERLDERPTDNPQAYRLYMQGREYLGRTVFDRDNLIAAEVLLKKAVELDPEFAQAWGVLAYTYGRLYWLHGRRTDQLKKLEEAAEWAHFYGPELAETYLANGVYLYWTSSNNWQTLDQFESALQIFPNEPMLHFMTALTHRRLRNWEEMIDYLKKSLELDPLNHQFHIELAFDYQLLRDYEQAEDVIDRLAEFEPNSFTVLMMNSYIGLAKEGTLDGFEYWWDQIQPLDPAIAEPIDWRYYNTLKRDWEEALRGYRNIESEIYEVRKSRYKTRTQGIAEILDYQGNKEQARVHYEQFIDHLLEEIDIIENEDPAMIRYRVELAKSYARIGEVKNALKEIEIATELMTPFRQEGQYWPNFEMQRAIIFTWAGEHELAIDKLEYLLSVPSEIHRNILRIHPRWDPLREHPRFQQLIAGEDEPYLEGL